VTLVVWDFVDDTHIDDVIASAIKKNNKRAARLEKNKQKR
jgi:hypothetical protein